MLLAQKSDDNSDNQITATETAKSGSRAVAMAAELNDREVNHTGWVANDPFFMPGSLLDNMPNYQLGMIHALGRFAFQMVDQNGRTRGSSQTDRSEEHTSELQSLMRISYAVSCVKKKQYISCVLLAT